MTRKFLEKVLTMGSVDTRNYRYVRRDYQHWDCVETLITRIPLSMLDTTACLDLCNWEVVYTYTTPNAN